MCTCLFALIWSGNVKSQVGLFLRYQQLSRTGANFTLTLHAKAILVLTLNKARRGWQTDALMN